MSSDDRIEDSVATKFACANEVRVGHALPSRAGVNNIETIVKTLARLPGLGPRSARRMLLYLLDNRGSVLMPLIDGLQKIHREVRQCSQCYNLDVVDPCHICRDGHRDHSQLCVVEQVADVWAMERGRIFGGYYHVLGGVLSAVEGVTPDDLHITELYQRCRNNHHLREVILATNLTVEGQTTAHYIGDLLEDLRLNVTRLAHGVPAGGELDYLDEGTLVAALKARSQF